MEASLRRAQPVVCLLGAARDAMDDRVVRNMMAGYAFVDGLVADGVDVLAIGQSRHVLEMNALVLCGTDPERRALYGRHLAATEERFYSEPGGGIGDLVEWHSRHRRVGARELAAGAAIRILTRPQLFVEGNHRTAALLMSYLLLRADAPPFVLTAAGAPSYFSLSAEISRADKHAPGAFLALPAMARRLSELIATYEDRTHLRH